ncbi:quercetin dioxygenase-like cupin family protein [Lysobacter niastensis]|uniref:Quercetin dioxygenase-like cupin family protein n=1 Tax=Lysobacter niastensis TaxID=380629 RepID=A0ABU1WC09_9GAMM|nr:cupin domain-containing protein [Lysobacter niastensis]MDR7135022.1 quercetin dioxygenase-like cupin family protein [Lysobacter niastensis]
MRINHLLTVAALLWSGTLAAQGPQGRDAPHPVVKPVMTEALPDYPGKEALVLTVDYPPGGASPLHHHDAHTYVYVLEGSVVMAVKGGKEVTLMPGQSWGEKPGDVHTVSRNASQTKPAKFVVFMLKDIGKPAVIPGP